MIRYREEDGISRFSRWSDNELEKMYQNSLRILAEIGITVQHEEGKELLADAGAAVEGDLVKIPSGMILDAVASAPASYCLYDTDGEPAVPLEPNVITYGLGTEVPEFADLETGDFHTSTLADCIDVMKVAQACKNIDYVSPYAWAGDKDGRISDLYQFWAMRKYSKKPLLTAASDPYSLQGMIDMAAAQAGGYDALREKPFMIMYTEPLSPLQTPEDEVAKILLCAEYSIPLVHCPGVMAGMTGPVTLAGAVSVGLAECLAGLVIHQLKTPGAPFMLGVGGTIMDMKTTAFMFGGPEFSITNTFIGEMGRYLGLPSFGISGATDAKDCDLQMGSEMIFSMGASLYGRQNFVHDNGYMALGQGGCLQAIVAANEMLGFVARYARGMEVSDETLCFDMIKEVGPGGEFLTRKETMKGFRKEFFIPEFFQRERTVTWKQNGKPPIKDHLTAKVRKILAGEAPTFLDEQTEQKFFEIIGAHEAHLDIPNGTGALAQL